MKEKAYYIVSKARQILGGTISADQCRDYVLALLLRGEKRNVSICGRLEND